jgi:hypothetical protein
MRPVRKVLSNIGQHIVKHKEMQGFQTIGLQREVITFIWREQTLFSFLHAEYTGIVRLCLT